MRRHDFLIDYCIPSALVLVCLFQPYFYHGILDLFELNAYLPFINEVLRGAALFRDAVIVRGPFEIYLPALLMSLFGKHLNVLHFSFYIANLLTLVLAVILARRLLRTRMFTYLLIPVIAAYSFTLVWFKNWGGWRHACGMLTMVLFVWYIQTRKRALLFLAGIFTMCAFAFSLEMGIIPAGAILLSLLLGWYITKSRHEVFPEILTYVQGISVVALPLVLYLIFTGSLMTYLKILVIVPWSGHTVYHFEILFPDVPHNALQAFKFLGKPFKPEFIWGFALLIYIPLVIIFFWRLKKKKIGLQDIPLCAVTVYALGMYLGSFRQINGPQFLVSLPGLFIVFFYILEYLFLLFKRRQLEGERRWLRPAGLVLFSVIFPLVFLNVFKVKNFLDYGFDLDRVVFRQISRGAFPSDSQPGTLTIERAGGVIVPGWQAAEINAVVSFVEREIPADEPLFCFPDRGAYHFFADRPCWSRFCWMDVASYDPVWTEEFFHQLYNLSPRYIIASMEEEVFESFLKTYPIAQNRQKVREFIKKQYVLQAKFGSVEIYRIKDADNNQYEQ